MFKAPKRFRRTAIAAVSICTLVLLPACQPASKADADGKMSAAAEFQQARQQYARAAERLAKEATPITDRAALAKRLNLTPKRFGAIKTGAQVTGPIVLAFDQGSNCTGVIANASATGTAKKCSRAFAGAPARAAPASVRGI